MGIISKIAILMGSVSYFLAYITGIAIHVYTCMIAYDAGGWVFGVFPTLFLPFIAECFFFFRVGNEIGYSNSYSLMLGGWILININTMFWLWVASLNGEDK